MVDKFEVGSVYRLTDSWNFCPTNSSVRVEGDTFTCGRVDSNGDVWDVDDNLIANYYEYHCFALVDKEQNKCNY